MKSLFSAVAGGLLAALIAASPAAAQGDLRKLRMAEVVRSQFYVPMYVALTKGFVAQEGLDVELVTANGGDKVGALLLTDQVDFALSGPEVPIYIHNGESPDKPRIFSALTATDGLFFVSREPIADFDWSMVDGKTIMGWRPGSTPQLYLEYVLKQNGVDAATIDGIITNIGPQAREGAWISGTGDFAIFNEPALTKLEQAGALNVLASIGAHVGRADYTVFFAKSSWLEENPEAAQGWTNAIGRAQRWIETATDADIAEAIAPFFPGLTPEDNLAVVLRYRGNSEPIWAESTVVSPEGLAMAQKIMVIGGVMREEDVVDYDVIVATEFAEAAETALASN